MEKRVNISGEILEMWLKIAEIKVSMEIGQLAYLADQFSDLTVCILIDHEKSNQLLKPSSTSFFVFQNPKIFLYYYYYYFIFVFYLMGLYIFLHALYVICNLFYF